MTKRKLFGTDGIRGRANLHPMTGEIAMALGKAVTYYFQNNAGAPRTSPLIIIGKDTRRSCYMLEQAFASGVCSPGGQAVFTGPLPTPGVAFVTESMLADAGVMISASHNPFYDNGIKIFDHTGHKLPDSVELELERLIENPGMITPKTHENVGRAERLHETVGRYIVHAKSAYTLKQNLNGLRLVVDCANGAGYKVGPMIFEELGAEVIPLGVNPNGININDKCGALHPENCAKAVTDFRADLGICLDGDADRLIMIDEKGRVVDGDQLIGVLSNYLREKKQLAGDEVIGTVMSNSGLEQYLTKNKIKFHRTQVGDRYIMEQMQKSGAVFGGEPSGHLIFKDYATTGDGILAAIKVIEAIKHFNKPLSELVSEVELFPQILINVQVKQKVPFETLTNVKDLVARVEKDLSAKGGRVLLRYSGTENLARVMVEGPDEAKVKSYCEEISEEIKKTLV